MNQDEYIAKRVDAQAEWYSEKSRWNKRLFHCLRIPELVSAVLAAALAGRSAESDWAAWGVTVFGLLVVICSGIINVTKCQELWVSYRSTSEALMHEKYMFEARVGTYSGDDSFDKLVLTCESIMSRENHVWINVTSQKREDERKKSAPQERRAYPAD